MLRYASSCRRLLVWRVSWTARKASRAFPSSVRDFGSAIRAICIGMVDAPDSRRPARALPNEARAMAIGFTPGCRQNHRSSDASTARTSSGGTSSSVTGMRSF